MHTTLSEVWGMSCTGWVAAILLLVYVHNERGGTNANARVQ
jgi:hypothetical protein